MALSANKDRGKKNAGKLQLYPVADTQHIFEGSFCVLNSTGYLEVATDATSKRFAGVAYEEADNRSHISGHADAFVSARVYRSGVFKATSAAVDQADVGVTVYVVDDDLLGPADEASNDLLAGVCVEIISATEHWVDIEQGVTGVQN